MSVLITIGDFSRMTHLSVKALRHYHEVGLLEPQDVDPNSGYRLYGVEQVPVAQVIRRFRDLGMPIDEVRSMLTAPDVETRNKVITDHLERMESQLADTAATVASLRSMLESPLRSAPVEFRHVPATKALSVTARVRVEDFESWWVRAFGELRSVLLQSGLSRGGPDGALYPEAFFEDEEGDVVAFTPVEARTRLASATGPVEVTEIPGAELAIMVHAGTIHDLDHTYGALGTEVATRGVGVSGPIREYYVVGPLDTPAESEYRTEVCWPVFRTAKS